VARTLARDLCLEEFQHYLKDNDMNSGERVQASKINIEYTYVDFAK